MKEQIIKTTVTPTISIVILGEDGAPDKTWKLCLDYRALARIEQETEIDLKRPADWAKIKSGETFPKVVWCCLARYTPDVTLDDVINCLNPEAHALLWNALYDITFPGLAEAYAEYVKAGKDKSPNEAPVNQTT